MNYRQPAFAQSAVIDLGATGSLLSLASFLALLVGLVLLVVAVTGAYVLSTARAPVTLECTRSGDAVQCAQKREGLSPLYFESKLEEVHLVHVSGRSPQDCVAFGPTLTFGGHAKDNVAAIRSLAPGEHRVLDATSEGGAFGMIMAFGCVLLLLLVVFVSAVAASLSRLTRVRVTVFADRIDIVTARWGFLRSAARSVPRARHEEVRVELSSRGGRGSLPRWQLAYVVDSDTIPLAYLSALGQPPALAAMAERLRSALYGFPSAH